MSTQVAPALSAHVESYIDCKRAAEFLSVDRKTIQRLSVFSPRDPAMMPQLIRLISSVSR
jgi:hypothetical protein